MDETISTYACLLSGECLRRCWFHLLRTVASLFDQWDGGYSFIKRSTSFIFGRSSYRVVVWYHPDGWEAKAQTIENNREGLDDDITTIDVNDDHCGNASGAGGVGGGGPSTIPGDQDNFGRVTSFTNEDQIKECPRCEPASQCFRRFLTQMGLSMD